MIPATASRTLQGRPLRADRTRSGGGRSSSARVSARAGRALFASCMAATVLLACPLYSDDCDRRSDCASGFYCEQFSQRCRPILDEPTCSRPSQCEVGETCTPDFFCRPGSCDYHGCVRGFRCGVVDSAHTCVPITARDPADAGPVDASTPEPADAGQVPASLADASLGGAGGEAGDAAVDSGAAASSP